MTRYTTDKDDSNVEKRLSEILDQVEDIKRFLREWHESEQEAMIEIIDRLHDLRNR